MITKADYDRLNKDQMRQVKAELWDYVKKITSANAEVTAALVILVPWIYRKKKAKYIQPVPKWKQFASMFDRIGDKVNESELVKRFKAGRTEGMAFVRENIQKTKPRENTKWITFDRATGIYRLIAIQQTPPENWHGYTIEKGKGRINGL